MFWGRKKGNAEEANLSGPKTIPELVGRTMVVDEQKSPDWVWTLKSVVREVGKKEYYCRIFEESQAAKANVHVKDWSSLDGHPELVLWEGYINKETNVARKEKFAG